jgi:two-component system response regulator RegX3
LAKKILIIENEGLIAGLLSRALQQKGFTITTLEPSDALGRVRKRGTSLVLWEAPSTVPDAVATCKSLRDLTTAPIVALVDSPIEFENVDGVECVVKPLNFRDLLATVESTLKLQTSRTKRRPRVLRCGDLALDLRTHRLTKGKEQHHLTPKEYSLLAMFMRNQGQVLTHKAIMKKVWKTDYTKDLRTLHVHVSWLRKKIEDTPKQPMLLRTVRGVGYRFEGKP